jgi:fructose-1,6-bisphosphatase/sedoheptulose 1,7-bisphosphatase-like protein
MINDVETGSFTAPGQTQTLYVISVGECNASHAEMFGTKRVVIFSGRQLVADVDVNFKDNIERKSDLNSDGIDELLMTTADMHQGNIDEVASLLSFQNGRVQVIHDFGPIIEDTCASLRPGSSSKASVLYISDVFPGNMPKFTVENYQTGCGRTKRWRLISRGKLRD